MGSFFRVGRQDMGRIRKRKDYAEIEKKRKAFQAKMEELGHVVQPDGRYGYPVLYANGFVMGNNVKFSLKCERCKKTQQFVYEQGSKEPEDRVKPCMGNMKAKDLRVVEEAMMGAD